MKGKRTGIEFEKHEVITTKEKDLLVHYLKKPDSGINAIKYINTNDIMAVTGDYGNWIFCREFHPSAKGHADDGYWKEKLTISSSQEPQEFDEEETTKEIKDLLANVNQDDDLTKEEKEYLEGCLDNVSCGEFDYQYYAHRENVGRFADHEGVPDCKKTKFWLLAVFDGFDEICRRMKEEEQHTSKEQEITYT